MTEFRDETIQCNTCGKNFIWAVKEQEFFRDRGLKNKPTRCIDCRKRRREALKNEGELIDISCSKCGTRATSPFIEAKQKTLYCASCFEGLKESIQKEEQRNN